MKSRTAVLIAIVAAAVLAVGGVAFALLGGDDARPRLNAVAYPTPIPAPVTTGVDYDGAPLTVPRAGRPAIVTFLYARCLTVCPLVGNQIAAALDRLPAETVAKIDVVAISVDPAGDTRAEVARFLRNHGLSGRMRYLVGTRAQLDPVWRKWSIVAQPEGDAIASVHTARVVMIDRHGDQLGSYPGGLPIPPDKLAADIRALTGS